MGCLKSLVQTQRDVAIEVTRRLEVVLHEHVVLFEKLHVFQNFRVVLFNLEVDLTLEKLDHPKEHTK